MNWQSILKFILGILVVMGVVWGGYYFWQNFVVGRRAAEGPPALAPRSILAELPTEGRLAAISANPVFNYWINSVTGTVYYLNPLGQVFRKVGEGEEGVNSQTLNNLNRVQAAPNGTFAIVRFNYPIRPTFSVFNTVTNSWQPLPETTIAAAWATSSQQLAYLEQNNNSGALKILNIISQKTQEVIKLNLAEAELFWPKPTEIYFLTTAPTADLTASLWSVSIKNKTLRPLIKEEAGLTLQWPGNGEFGLKLDNFQRAPVVNLLDSSTNVLRPLSFITLPEKCVFAETKLYCGVPKFLKEGLVLPDDYYKKAVYFQDDLFAIDLNTGTVALLFNGDEKLIDAFHLTVHDNQLYFINRYDNLLYRLRL